MQAEPSPDKTPPPDPTADDAQSPTADALGSDAEVIGVSTVIGASNDLDFVDEALDALDQDDLERAEELAERLQSSDSSDQS